MARLNPAVIRFTLGVAGVAVGTTILGHLAPPKSPDPGPADPPAVSEPEGSGVGPDLAHPAAPDPTSAPVSAPQPAQPAVAQAPTPQPATETAPPGMTVETTSTGGRLIVLRRVAPVVVQATPTPAAPATPVAQAPAPPPAPAPAPVASPVQVTPAPKPAPTQPLPPVKTRKS